MIMINQGTYRSIYNSKCSADDAIASGSTIQWLRTHGLKLLVCLLLALLIFTSFLLIHTNASGGDDTSGDEWRVTVGSGDTLWSIASRHAEAGDDIGYLVYRIKQRNGLENVTIHPGQQLIIPGS